MGHKIGELTKYNPKTGAGQLTTANEEMYYCYGYDLRKHHIYRFTPDIMDDEVARDLKEITMPFKIRQYTLFETFLSLLIALILGAIMAIFMVRTVHAEPVDNMRTEDITLLAKLAHAEAHNQDVDGMKYVVAVVLNRQKSPLFPNTIEEVVYQSGQFSVISNGNFDKSIPEESDYEAVMQEVNHRSNTDILYFRAGGYGKSGKPAFKFKDHFFSK